jgi:hypothetical protein
MAESGLAEALAHLVLALKSIVDPDLLGGWSHHTGASPLYRSRQDGPLFMSVGPSFDGMNEKPWGWWWTISLSRRLLPERPLAGADVADRGCTNPQAILDLVTERAEEIKRSLPLVVPGWDHRHAAPEVFRHERTSRGLVLSFATVLDGSRYAGWDWTWEIHEGATNHLLANGRINGATHLDFAGIASVVEAEAEKLDGAQGLYR